ncbi:hypothetical protein LOTGIDRAFT_229308 [Lottia gigantea]|uniref:Uncharacterized protein n=1 Tax=Lottia gigantea TaxID=225164 RepID=V3ZX02_LOTGI|nr:hypothetical protein LOTGIDRAFT_229308 [Lottia gigantea]ESO87155.1 hypothetical protein LOTGIDRAFT_229308 [Lottia gigantea]
MAELENIPIGDYTKAGLVKELQECNIINTRLETEYQKRESVGQTCRKHVEWEKKSISFSTEMLESIVEKDKSVLEEVANQYLQLYELNGCDKKLCSKDNGPASTTAQSQSSDCDCKKVEEVKDALLKLLKDNFELCGKLKENIRVFRVTAKYYPDQASIPSGQEVVTPAIISELVEDICKEMDKILMNCKKLWDGVDRSSGHLRDSGIGNGLSDSFDSLAINSNASNEDIWNGVNVNSRHRSASENTDNQTDVKSFE